MIYARNTRRPQYLAIPRSLPSEELGVNIYTLELKSTINKTVHSYTVHVEEGYEPGYDANYYVIHFAFPEKMQAGEYEYQLKQANYVYGSGLLVIGEYEEEVKEVESETQFKQYED